MKHSMGRLKHISLLLLFCSGLRISYGVKLLECANVLKK